MRYNSADDKDRTVTMMRTDTPHAKQNVDNEIMKQFFTILGGYATYLVYMEDSLPKKVMVKGLGVTK